MSRAFSGVMRVVDSRHTEPVEEDWRVAVARRKLEAARAELEAKEADKPRSQRKTAAGPAPKLIALVPSIAPTVFVHAILLAIALTLAGLALVACYYLLFTAFVAGRVIALPTGILCALALSYASGCYLGIVESTSQGHTTVDDALHGDWRDWFWSLPMTLGMVALAAAIGYCFSLLAPDNAWQVIGVTTFFLYPFLQLSALETASPAVPFSIPVLRSLVVRPIAWLAFYAVSAVVVLTTFAAFKATWRDPPWLTFAVMGPVETIALLAYGWLLGQLAQWIGGAPSE